MAMVPLSAIVKDYRDNKLASEITSDWGSVVFYRPPAFVLAWLLVPLGISPNQVTIAGALLIPLMAVCAWLLAPASAVIAVTLLGIAFNILDCSDGVLARALGRHSVLGRYMDFASDILFRLTCYASFGLIADKAWPGAAFPWVAVGLCCGLFGLYARVNRIFAEDLYVEEDHQKLVQADIRKEAIGGRSLFERLFSFLSGLDTLLPLIAFLAWQAGVLREALVWYVLYTAGDAVVELATTYVKVRQIDDRHRNGG